MTSKERVIAAFRIYALTAAASNAMGCCLMSCNTSKTNNVEGEQVEHREVTEGLWNSIQGTADQAQEVAVYAAPVLVAGSNLDRLIERDTSEALPIDRLIYSAASVEFQTPSTFAGSTLTITAPNFHTIPAQPNYGVQIQGLGPFTPTADDGSGVFYFDGIGFVVVSLYALRLEAASGRGSP